MAVNQRYIFWYYNIGVIFINFKTIAVGRKKYVELEIKKTVVSGFEDKKKSN